MVGGHDLGALTTTIGFRGSLYYIYIYIYTYIYVYRNTYIEIHTHIYIDIYIGNQEPPRSLFRPLILCLRLVGLHQPPLGFGAREALA